MEKLGSGDPQRIGRYRLLGRLGAGGMGQVFLARSDRGRTVAIKLVRPDLAEQQQFRDRFRAEVRAARRVGGAWTAPVLDADTDAAVPWVATGYIAGPSLHRIVSGRPGAPATASEAYGPLPGHSVRVLGAGLACALQDIHRAGIVHRDLKPSNVLVTIDGPRVIDFGIARALDTVTEDGLTRTGALIGSPGFMSPEQVRGERVTAACDVFCLGSVLAYAATGRMPFGGADSGVHALMFRIAQEDPDLTGIPVDLVELIQDCLTKDPGARPSTDDVLERLGETETAETWLPGALTAQLGRQAVGLLDVEDPQDPHEPPQGPPEAPPQPSPAHSGPPAPEPPHPAAPPGPVATAVPPVAAQSPGAPPGAGQPQPARAVPSAPPPPSYGYPQPPPPAYAHGYGPTPPYGPSAPPFPTPAPVPAPERRHTGAAVTLVLVAVLVAIGAGWTVFTFMNGADDHTTASPTPTPTGGASTDPSADGQSGDGALPAGYLGTWAGVIDSGAGSSTRRLVIRQGGVGDTVLSLTAEGPLATGGSYHCVFQAELRTTPTSGSPVDIGPSRVTSGAPASSCTPGKPTVLTLLPDGSLRREIPDTGESLTYTRTG
ncbi:MULTISPECIES: serine/threonine-protein kinase [unclassified Streptomyces]|uniref:serine/threonine-protein kinase n=1 Tax=unclassified Streptomyces TaxID=2593676 RepID=UPI0001C1A2ED|nr:MULTISPECIES: serine/threonine-protein kinase [unclassified Streptomyces]AEN10928.1 serine/threonine protein kinase [Streptomyces sp. SirexAA-E]MYR69331.1 protein kinase [Streptomyces sp. SID4939]MYT63803.1 protein kinase [Streptomyces sp. SID8357]MYT86053.1 protein kinase [Streptomyces sp. SID8360]MYW38396.1 protein kinase [Streptomyces sp. SID1]